MTENHSNDQLVAEAQALFATFAEGQFAGDPPTEVIAILSQLPEDSCQYERGILALLAGKDDEGIAFLHNAVIERLGKMNAPPRCEAFEAEWVNRLIPFSTLRLWDRLAAAFGEVRPNWAATLFLRGLAASGRDDSTSAEKWYRKCFESDSTYWTSATRLALIFDNRGRLGETRSWFQKALKGAQAKSDYALIHALWGECEQNIGDIDAAIDHYLKALDYQPNDWETLCSLGDLYLNAKNWRTALAYYEDAEAHAAEESDETRAEILFSAAWCYGKLKERDNEAAAYRRCLELDSNYPYARNNLGCSLEKSGQLQAAEVVFREAIEIANDGKYPLRNLARVLRKLGRFGEAVELRKRDTCRGRLTKSAERAIEELEALLDKQKNGEEPVDEFPDEDDESDEAIGTGREEEYEDDDDVGAADSEAPAPPKSPIRRNRKDLDTQIARERILEGLLEMCIDRGREVFGRKLRMFQSSDSEYRRYGRQFPIPNVGRLDLLTIEQDSGDLVVIELKRGQSERDTVGQIRQYMGWVSLNLASNGQRVHGIICVWEATDALRYAIHGMPDIEAFEYSLEFTKI